MVVQFAWKNVVAWFFVCAQLRQLCKPSSLAMRRDGSNRRKANAASLEIDQPTRGQCAVSGGEIQFQFQLSFLHFSQFQLSLVLFVSFGYRYSPTPRPLPDSQQLGRVGKFTARYPKLKIMKLLINNNTGNSSQRSLELGLPSRISWTRKRKLFQFCPFYLVLVLVFCLIHNFVIVTAQIMLFRYRNCQVAQSE